ncbi:MAG: Spy/CpxP family protein refolding chaperone [Acidobacteriota bacterium]
MKKLAAMVAAVSIVALAALAYGDMDGRGMGPGMMCGCGMDGRVMGADHDMSQHLMGLNLDEQQKASIGEIRSRMMKETIRRTADMRIAQVELKDLLSQDPVDMKAVEAKVKQLEAMRTEMQLSHIKAMEECKSKLTPEQRKKLREMIEAGPMMGGMGIKHGQERGMRER